METVKVPVQVINPDRDTNKEAYFEKRRQLFQKENPEEKCCPGDEVIQKSRVMLQNCFDDTVQKETQIEKIQEILSLLKEKREQGNDDALFLSIRLETVLRRLTRTNKPLSSEEACSMLKEEKSFLQMEREALIQLDQHDRMDEINERSVKGIISLYDAKISRIECLLKEVNRMDDADTQEKVPTRIVIEYEPNREAESEHHLGISIDGRFYGYLQKGENAYSLHPGLHRIAITDEQNGGEQVEIPMKEFTLKPDTECRFSIR